MVSPLRHSSTCQPARVIRGTLAPVLATAGALVAWPVMAGQEQAPAVVEPVAPVVAPLPDDGLPFPIGAIELAYGRPHPDLPPIEEALQIQVVLGHTEEGFVAPRAGVPSVVLLLGDVALRPLETYYGSAIQHILKTARDHFTALGLIGIYIAPDPRDIDETGEDLRPADQTTLRILILTGVVSEMRTIASGQRFPPEHRVDHPLHARIRERSPVAPRSAEGEPQRDLLDKDAIDRYIFFLSRHPGRRVDVALSPATEPGSTALDYLVTENKAFTVYSEVSNTGTASINKWRERFGFFHTQLTNRDDILAFEYTTAGFDNYHAMRASYEAPFPGDGRVRWRATGTFGDFSSLDVGIFIGEFTGTTWTLGGDVIANVFQEKELFIDVVGGLRFLSTEVQNPLVGKGEEHFMLPHVGVALERRTELARTVGLLDFEWQIGDLTGVDPGDLARLGRTLPDRDWAIMRWAFEQSFYLEPLVNRAGWEDPSTPATSTLAHELVLSFRGQHAFGNRLIPELEQTVGGLYTVRGYDESVVAGDTVLVAGIEYRYHLPKGLPLDEEPGEVFGRTFRFARQYVYGPTDWDLIFKAFLDAGGVIISDPFSFEKDEFLLGAGIGVELHYRRNVRVRLDWGTALEAIESRGISSGDSRVHFVATILF